MATLRAFGNYDADQVSRETALVITDEPITQQHQAEEADINFIVNRYLKSGRLPDDYRTPRYGDFTTITDYRGALHQVMEARDSFMRLPGKIRAHFDHDPEQFVDCCLNPARRDEAISLGLIEKAPVSGGSGSAASPEPAPAAVSAANSAPALAAGANLDRKHT